MSAQPDPTSRVRLTATVAAIVRGEADAWWRLGEWDAAEVRRVAVDEGMAPLAAEALADNGAPDPWKTLLRGEAIRASVREAVSHPVVSNALSALQDAGVRLCVVKGAHLAYTCYPRPEWRPRLDTDVVIAPADRARVRDALRALGYLEAPGLGANLITYQSAFSRATADGSRHVIDIHWRPSNAHAYADAVAGEELLAESAAIPALGPGARGPSWRHALMLAIVHPVAHHPGRERLIWDHDVALIAGRMTDDDWRAFVAMANDRRLGGLCAVRLARAVDIWSAQVPAWILAALRSGHDARTIQVRAARPVLGLLADVRALPRWQDRVRLLSQHLLPPAQYMREGYAPGSRAPLAGLYARRAVVGAVKYCRRRPPLR